MSIARPIPLKFTVGPRTLFSFRRRLHRIALSLEDVLDGRSIDLPPLADADGWLITSLPAARLATLATADHLTTIRQSYPRRYADLSGSFESYFGYFSAGSRSSLKRKMKRLTAEGGVITSHHRPDQIADFHRAARVISLTSYQERLLDAGLPDDPDFVSKMHAAAATGTVRAWLLHIAGRPAAYLYCPAKADTLVYAYLGYDPSFAALSPGSVLQLQAMRDLFAEQRFARFDFTEGDGQHKRQFATGSVDCVDLLLLRRTLPNRLTIAALRSFDHLAETAKGLGLSRTVQRFIR